MKLLSNVILGVAEDLRVGDLLFVYGEFRKVIELDLSYRRFASSPRSVSIELEGKAGKPGPLIFDDPNAGVIFQRPEEQENKLTH